MKKQNRAEANQLLIVYSQDFGKLPVLARSIRKNASKLRSGIELFYLSEIEFIQGKTYKTLTDVRLIDSFKNLRQDFNTMQLAFKIAQLADRLIKEQEKDEKLWQLLLASFSRLDSFYPCLNTYYLAYYYFLWNLISLIGFAPDLYFCRECKTKVLPERLYLAAEAGGIICQNCSKKVKLKKPIEIKTIKLLRLILNQSWPMLSKIDIGNQDIKELNSLSDYYLSIASDYNQ